MMATTLTDPITEITANGTYMIPQSGRSFTIGAYSVASGNTATIQLFGEIAGAVTDLDAAQTPTFGSPVAWPNEYTMTGRRGIVVTDISGAIRVEVAKL